MNFHRLRFGGGICTRIPPTPHQPVERFDCTPSHAFPDPINHYLFWYGGYPKAYVPKDTSEGELNKFKRSLAVMQNVKELSKSVPLNRAFVKQKKAV